MADPAPVTLSSGLNTESNLNTTSIGTTSAAVLTSGTKLKAKKNHTSIQRAVNRLPKQQLLYELFEDEEEKEEVVKEDTAINPPNSAISRLYNFISDLFTEKVAQNSYELLAHACDFRGKIDDLKSWASIRRLKRNCILFQDILTYINNSKQVGHYFRLVIHQIYKVDRIQQNLQFSQEPYRIMLWHGTHAHYIPSIIQNGVRKSSGGWFGAGTYLADRFGTSLSYAWNHSFKGYKFLILAEVSPGKVYKCRNIRNHPTPPEGFDSTKGMGSMIPDWTENKRMYGAILPSGKTIRNTRHPSYPVRLSEYVIFDTDRIKIRFIVQCSTC